MLAEEQSDEFRQRMSGDENARKDFVKNVRELLSVAAEAKSRSLADRPAMKRQMETARANIISQAYTESRQAVAISDADIEAFYKNSANEDQFQQFLKDAQANNSGIPNPVPEEQSKQIRQHLGRVMIGAQRGTKVGLDKSGKVQLKVLMQQAQVLASMYSQESLVPQTRATGAEIDAYTARHPELNSDSLRPKAEEVLRRALSR